MSGAAWRVLARGAGFVEGPVAQGEHVDFVSINRGTVCRARLDGSGFQVRAELGGGPNGMAADGAGRLWVVQNGARVMESKSERAAVPGVQVVDGDDTVTAPLALPGLQAPNDCAFGPDGRLWFTDPYGRLMPAAPDPAGAYGRVWAYDTVSGELELIAEHLPHPNGLCFGADGELLYVTDTRTAAVVALEVAGRGVRPVREIATLPEGKPDGVALAADGSMWIAATTADAVAVLSPRGEWDYVRLGESFPTNVCFAGPDLSTVVVTAARGGRVLAWEASVPGLALETPAAN
ncbi:SMP-30/gluconolactonase/LRE family protein [Amycolatopsis sp. Poz14]|uniref:SMP-30/gluconolactonase/LRE family protein n=1 Tax=Amycolatopsis sp. Poz14 TaxID=1447705 RepID=UPI001EE97BB0|nr:SMP-30/gluconolactonase/LRE family protein [Amycolatopsis sp. Poz14]MCG3754023.1 SMP-30/gluconolactonase/LRE family protein [Amycolatopsis sp. Poz14]